MRSAKGTQPQRRTCPMLDKDRESVQRKKCRNIKSHSLLSNTINSCLEQEIPIFLFPSPCKSLMQVFESLHPGKPWFMQGLLLHSRKLMADGWWQWHPSLFYLHFPLTNSFQTSQLNTRVRPDLSQLRKDSVTIWVKQTKCTHCLCVFVFLSTHFGSKGMFVLEWGSLSLQPWNYFSQKDYYLKNKKHCWNS